MVTKQIRNWYGSADITLDSLPLKLLAVTPSGRFIEVH